MKLRFETIMVTCLFVITLMSTVYGFKIMAQIPALEHAMSNARR